MTVGAFRPVWLFSLDAAAFGEAVPYTTGLLTAYFRQHGNTAGETDLQLVHFGDASEVDRWSTNHWSSDESQRGRHAARSGLRPVAAFSCYVWNIEPFLRLAATMKRYCPEILVVAGGPQVQAAEDYLGELIDVIALGEGEITFTELLDVSYSRDAVWDGVSGIAYRPERLSEEVIRTTPRTRITDLDSLPSPLSVISLRDADGEPRFRIAGYETSRGCPYTCAYCEWGTGAIGERMYQYSPERIRSDVESFAAGGVESLLLFDSNFGALAADMTKAEIFVDVFQRTGRPRRVHMNWAKNHTERVMAIVELLHAHDLIDTYVLALQTLTPRALELSNRRNMRLNDYRQIVDRLMPKGVPLMVELIWGLPGDTLADFEQGLDELYAVFPSHSVQPYHLLPGTEFFERRDELQLKTRRVPEPLLPGDSDYVVATCSYSEDEGDQGFALLTAHNLLVRRQFGAYMRQPDGAYEADHVRGLQRPRAVLTVRYLALMGLRPSRFLRRALEGLLDANAERLQALDRTDHVGLYAHEPILARSLFQDHGVAFAALRSSLRSHLKEQGASPSATHQSLCVLEVDEAISADSRPAERRRNFSFRADLVLHSLQRMSLPDESVFSEPGSLDLILARASGDATSWSWIPPRAGDVIARLLSDRQESKSPPMESAV